jgi:hypothetical protein
LIHYPFTEPYHIGELAILIKEGMDAAFDPMIKDGSVEDVCLSSFEKFICGLNLLY